LADLIAAFLKPVLRLLFGSAEGTPRIYGLVLLIVAVLLAAATIALQRRRRWRLSDTFAAAVCVVLACLGVAMLIL
jgi:hypothetical protein